MCPVILQMVPIHLRSCGVETPEVQVCIILLRAIQSIRIVIGSFVFW
jgi:hypothetical protein